MQAQKDITFGRFQLDLTNECLWQGKRAISLRPKAFAVLRLLVENSGLLVTKQQVLDTVWPGTFVGDAVLKDSIRQLREALEDDAGAPIYIETAHRRGYRFIGKLSGTTPNRDGARASQKTFSESAPKVDAESSSVSAVRVLGREAELARMRSWLDRALAGERQTVFVTGEPGIGKTTLVQAFLEQAAQVPGVRVARGQCLEHYGSAEAYLPVLDAFSRLCRSRDGAQVLDLLREQAPAWLAQMPSAVPPSERQHLQSQAAGTTRERMLREMAEAIETLTSESALLLVLEDLHWSDYSTLDLVSYLTRRQDRARLMVVGTYRPVDVIVSEHPLKSVKRELQAHGLCHELPLEYLSEGAVGKYLTARFPAHEFPLRLRRAIYRRTEGNPLFMVDLVEYLAEQKMIVPKKEAWVLRVDLSEVEQGVPANLRQLIEKQIERLGADERAVLEAASVAGMECSCVAIAAGLDRPIEWVEKHCEELARRHQFLSPAWLVELPDGTITARHRFIHILYRDVPYRLMPPTRRSQIHQRIAERGVAIYGDRSNEVATELAMHFEQSRDWPRSLEYLLRAAEIAIARSAHHEARDLATRGLQVLKLLPETGETTKQEMKLRLTLGVSLMAVKGFASSEVEEVLTRGRDMFRRYGPSPELFHMLGSSNMYHQFSGDIQSSLELSGQLLELAEGLKDGSLIMEAHRSMGAVLLLHGRCTDALEHLNQGSALYDSHQKHRLDSYVGLDCKAMCECFAGRALWALGYPDQAAERTTGGLDFARVLCHPQTLVVACHLAAQLHHLRGEISLVEERAKEALEVADEYGLELWSAYGLVEVGWVEAERGNCQEGIKKIQQGLIGYAATGAKLWTTYLVQLLADQLAKAGRMEQALAAIEKALVYAEQSGEKYSLAELYRIKGELIIKSCDSVVSGDIHGTSNVKNEVPAMLLEPEACFAEALAIAKLQGTRSWELRAALSMDRLLRWQGNPTNSQLAKIYSLFTEGHETSDLKQAKARLEAAFLA
jgi:DNA-binding winged helix-turn-helix (wHTH) protein/predicted ATPase